MIEILPGKHLRHLTRMHLKYARRPRRYRRLLAAAATLRPRTIIEIGVFTGLRGLEMIEAASLGRGAAGIAYHGFDLFDLMDDGILARELSKRPDPMPAVQARLAASGAAITLHKGWSDDTLPAFAAANPDLCAELIFIDGGHAIETIRSDWQHVSPLLAPGGVVMFDDYYVDCPHQTDRFGCNQLMESLDPERWTWTMYPEVDRFVHDGMPHNVAITEVRRAGG
ncbi:MAG: putative O-methyltransferase YrrM [Paracoccaceae bacterium]|jgi:predicted O-methyltransferase YrrM